MSRMHLASALGCAAALLLCTSTSATELDGYGPAGMQSSGLQVRTVPGLLAGTTLVDFALPRPAFLSGTRLGLWAEEALAKRSRLLPSWRLLGDESLLRPSGLRASAGVISVSRAVAFGTNALPEQAVIDTLPAQRLGSASALASTASAPYLGVGWREAPALHGSANGGAWGFNADIGLMALSPRSTVRLGRTPGGPLTLDDVTRDLRLTPLLQLGVVYSF